MKIKIILISLFAVVIIAALITVNSLRIKYNSSQSPSPTPAKKGPVTITFTTFFDEDGQAAAYKDIISLFESRNSNIKVNLQAGAVNYDDNIKTALTTGKGPDIMGLQRNNMLQYIGSDQIKDMTDWVTQQKLADKYYGVSLGYGKYKGKYYGIGDLPYTVEWFYNTDTFDNYGIKEPKNLDELITVCKRFSGNTQPPIAVGAKDTWAMNVFFGLISGQTINTDELAEGSINNNKDSYTALSGAADAVNIFNQLLKSKAINRKINDNDYAAAIDAFVKGKSPILPMGSWAVDKINKVKKSSFHYSVFDEPVAFSDSPNSAYSATAVQVIVVNEKTKHLEEVKKFLSFLFSEEAQKIFAQKNGISGLKSVNGEPEDEVKKKILKHLEETDENSTMYMDNVSSKMMESTGSRLSDLVNGKMKVGDVWNRISAESAVK